MKTIWKYVIPLPSLANAAGGATHDVPFTARYRAGMRDADGNFAVWFEVDTEHVQRGRRFEWVGTGNPVPENATYRDSVVDPPFVWHLYEL